MFPGEGFNFKLSLQSIYKIAIKQMTTSTFTRINTLANFIADSEQQLQFTQLILQQLNDAQLLAVEEVAQEHIDATND